jgi:hypothetical protein
MKNLVPAFVIALALTGAVASSYTANASAESIKPSLRAGGPTPMCPPNDPNACGIGGTN